MNKKQFRDFESAREFARSLNLKSQITWNEYCKLGDKPEDIPAKPSQTYKNEWQGWGDFLGTGNVHKKQFSSFKKVRRYVVSLNLKSANEWREYCKLGKKPDDIPSHPHIIFKNNGWRGWGDFLGTGTIALYNIEYLSFNEARAFVRGLRLKNQNEWRDYCKLGEKPEGIPVNPDTKYKKDFKGYGDWLGTGTVASQLIQYRSFQEARKFVRSLGLKNHKEWTEYCKSGDKPEDIPATPNKTYKNKGWKNNGDWIGTGRIHNKDIQYRSFQEAREFARALNLKGQKEWREYCKSGDKPEDIPTNPQRTYKKEWKGLGDWTGTGNIAPFNKQYRSFQEAREFVRKLGLKNHKEWTEYCKSGDKPEDIPAKPWETYKEWNIKRRENLNEKTV
jgi:hypothetical protein